MTTKNKEGRNTPLTKWMETFFDEVTNKGNINFIDEYVSEDFVENETFPGLESGRDGLKQFFQMMRSAFPDLNVDIEFTLTQGDRVVVYAIMTGTHKGEFMGIPATGKKINVKEIDIVRIVDGKMVEHWGIADSMLMMQQLGVVSE